MCKPDSSLAGIFRSWLKERRSLLWTTLFALLALAGCATNETAAPRPTPAIAAAARTEIALLEQGRTIYTGRCATCHNPEPISRYPKSDWPEIIDRMSPKSELNPEQKRAVLAYVLALSH